MRYYGLLALAALVMNLAFWGWKGWMQTSARPESKSKRFAVKVAEEGASAAERGQALQGKPTRVGDTDRKPAGTGSAGLSEYFINAELGALLVQALASANFEKETALLEALRQDSRAVLDEVSQVLERLPKTAFAEEKVKLLQIINLVSPAEGTSSNAAGDAVGELALRAAKGDFQEVGDEAASTYEKYALPMEAFEIFESRLEASSDRSRLDRNRMIQGFTEIVLAQENPPLRRLLYKYARVLHPELDADFVAAMERVAEYPEEEL